MDSQVDRHHFQPFMPKFAVDLSSGVLVNASTVRELAQALELSSVESVRAWLKRLVSAHRALAEFKGVAASMPNQNILLSTLGLQEAKDSSEIENIPAVGHQSVTQKHEQAVGEGDRIAGLPGAMA